MKRAYSDSDLDEGEDYTTERCEDGEDDETTARKRRRGLIEKKRRDRINSCLTELRCLVPAAVDKQGSAKLEKAEILQLTVEYLKNLRNITKREPALHNSGADFRAVGFRECLSEVATYLQSFHDPSCKDEQKVNLLSHLNTMITHRLSASPQACLPRTSTPAIWPLTRGVKATQSVYESSNAVNVAKTAQQNAAVDHRNAKIPASVKIQDARLSRVADIKPAQNQYPFSAVYPLCGRNDILGFPFTQHREDFSQPEQMIYTNPNARPLGSDSCSSRKGIFCHFNLEY